MTTQLNELGFYVLAGAPQSPAELIDEVAGGRGARPRLHVHLRALQHQGGVHAVGRGRRGVVDARHRDRGDEPQHAPSDRHRVARDDDAPAHRRSVHARARARHRAAVRRVRHPADHDRADRGLRRAHAPAVEGRGDLRPRRPGRASSRCCTSTRRSTRTSRSASSRSVRTRSRSPAAASTRSCCTRSSPTRRSSAASRRCATRPRQAGRDPGVGAHLVVLRDDRRPPARGAAAQEDGRPARHLPPGLRRPARRDQRLGSRRCSRASAPTRSCRRSRARSTPRPTPTMLEHVATLLPDEWLEPAATGDAGTLRGAGAAPVRSRRRRRDHARRDAAPSSHRSSRRTGRSARTASRSSTRTRAAVDTARRCARGGARRRASGPVADEIGCVRFDATGGDLAELGGGAPDRRERGRVGIEAPLFAVRSGQIERDRAGHVHVGALERVRERAPRQTARCGAVDRSARARCRARMRCRRCGSRLPRVASPPACASRAVRRPT